MARKETLKMKAKRKFGFAAADDERIICRRILLNTLDRGPVNVESIVRDAERTFGFGRELVVAAAKYWNVTEEMRDGKLFWRKPDVLTRLPSHWNYRRDRSAEGRDAVEAVSV
jgi:hypothetical protein